MNTYICCYYILKNDERVDDFKEWCNASSLAEAQSEFEYRYSVQISNGTIEIGSIWKE